MSPSQCRGCRGEANTVQYQDRLGLDQVLLDLDQVLVRFWLGFGQVLVRFAQFQVRFWLFLVTQVRFGLCLSQVRLGLGQVWVSGIYFFGYIFWTVLGCVSDSVRGRKLSLLLSYEGHHVHKALCRLCTQRTSQKNAAQRDKVLFEIKFEHILQNWHTLYNWVAKLSWIQKVDFHGKNG